MRQYSPSLRQRNSPDRKSFIQPYDSKKPTPATQPRRYSSPVHTQSQQRFTQFRAYQKNDPISPERYLTIDQALHKSGQNVQSSPQFQQVTQSPVRGTHYQQSPVRQTAGTHYQPINQQDGRVSLRMRNGSQHQQINQQLSPGKSRSSQQLRHRDTRIIEAYQASPKRDTLKVKAAEQPAVTYTEDVTRLATSPQRGSVQLTSGLSSGKTQQNGNKGYRERYQELYGGNMLTDQSVQYINQDGGYADPLETQAPPSQIHVSPGARKRTVYSSPFEINSRQKDFSTFASKQSTNNRRFVFFGDYEVGKTSLWLRYIYFDQKRASISVEQTPNRDGYIFEKSLADGYTNYSIQAWDFLTPLEARQCLNLKIEDQEHARYDAVALNKEYISSADVAVMVYDVTKQYTLDWCREEATKLAAWGVKKFIFAGNKSDGEIAIDVEDAEAWFQENQIQNFFVCSTNNVGTQDLFMEMDRVDLDPGGSVYTLDCLQGMKTEYARVIYAEEQEIACMQLAWLSFRAEMKYYENQKEKNSYYIRSDLNDVLAKDIDREHQINEINAKIPEIKDMLENQVRIAEDLGVSQTAEYEEANRKLMEIGIIQERLEAARTRIRKENRRLNCCICLTLLLMFLMFYLAMAYGMEEPDMTLANAQKQAEKEMLQYNIGMIVNLKQDAEVHKLTIEKYKQMEDENIENLKTVKDAPVSQIDTQVSYLEKALRLKEKLITGGMYLPKKMHHVISEIKTLNKRMFHLALLKEDMVDGAFYNQFKMLYNDLLLEILNQIDKHVQTGLMYDEYQSYLNDYKVQNKPEDVTKQYLNDRHDKMNKNIKVIINIGHYDYKAAKKVIAHFNEMVEKFIKAQSRLIDQIQGLKAREIGYAEARSKCIKACQNYKTKTCSTMEFDTGVNAATRPKLDGLQLWNQFQKPWIWYKAKHFVRKLMGEDLTLPAATQQEQNTLESLKGYRDDAQKVADLVNQYKKGFSSGSLEFSQVAPLDFNENEKKIFEKYTDTTCEEAEDVYHRFLKMAKYFALFLTFLILMLLMLCCCGCLTCVKWRKNRRKNNFFGHNNGEDNLEIDHHWQEDSEPKPIYINVRDPHLKEIQVLKQGQHTY